MHKAILLAVISVAVAGCILTSEVDLVGCKGFLCRVTPYAQMLAADGSEVTLPLKCRDEAWSPNGPKGQHEWLKAIAYTPSNGQWRSIAFTDDQLGPENRPSPIPPGRVKDWPEPHHCAADCSRYVYQHQINPPGHGYHYEVFYGENGVERQLTHFDDKGAMWSWAILSADGRVAVVKSGRAIALIDVASGQTQVVPFAEAAWKECTGSR